MSAELYQQAKNSILSGDYSVKDFFMQNDYILEYAYCQLCLGDAQAAKSEFKKIASTDFRADWGVKLIQFIQGYVEVAPSYFQIRNFLEIDLNLLIQAGQAQFVENIINGADIFYSINPESYKFIARVMLNNDFINVALYYLNQAKDKFYHDPEMHFMLANCYVKMGEILNAKESLKLCLSILPGYFPARTLLTKLNSV